MEKLYYRQPYVKAFEAVVTDCREGKNGRDRLLSGGRRPAGGYREAGTGEGT